MKLLSIILPVFRVEQYIRDCILSIFRQGLSDAEFEVILVDDGSPDNSIGILSDIIVLHDNIIVVNQCNQGVSIARNVGLSRSVGQYILFVDPDDLLVDNALSVLLPKAIESSADILVADYQRFNDGDPIDSLIHIEQQCKTRLISGADAFLEIMLPNKPWYIWRMMIKREFLISKQINFKPFWYEDSLFCHECFLKSTNCLRADYQLYVYRLRKESFTASINVMKMLDLNSSISSIFNLKDLKCISDMCRNRLMDNVFSSFNFALYCIVHNDTLYKERRKIVSDLKQKVPPSLFVFTSNFKQVFVSYAFKFMPYCYLFMRHSFKK